MSTTTQQEQSQLQSEIAETLDKKALLLNITVRCYGAEKTDPTLSREAEARAQAIAGSLRTIKQLFAGNDGHILKVKAAYSAVRTYAYSHTLPWSLASKGCNKIGPRLLPLMSDDGKAGIRVIAGIRGKINAAKDALVELEDVYDGLVAQQASMLGTAFNAGDYPAKEELKRLFFAEVIPSPVPSLDDYSKIALPADSIAALRNNAVKKVKQQMENAMEDMSKRALKELRAVANTLEKRGDEVPKARLYDSIVDRIASMASLMESANFSDDPVFTEIVDSLNKSFVGVSIDEMRDNPALCKDLSIEAGRLATKLLPVAVALAKEEPAVTGSPNTTATDDSEASGLEKEEQQAEVTPSDAPVQAASNDTDKWNDADLSAQGQVGDWM